MTEYRNHPGHDPEWDTHSPAFCPFAGKDCENGCPSNDKRVCVNGLEGEEE